MITCPCNEDPLTCNVYIVKFGFTGVYIIFFFFFALKHSVCSGFYQWYTNIVQGSTNGTIGKTIGTNGNANVTTGSANGTIGAIGKPMVPLALPLVPLVKLPMVPLGNPEQSHRLCVLVRPPHQGASNVYPQSVF